MKSNTWDDALLADHRSSIKAVAAKQAFDTLVAAAIEMPAYETKAAGQGDIRIFKYVDSISGARPFAFIVNQRDLLFYVRASGLQRVPGGISALTRQFDTAVEKIHGEWAVRIRSKEEAGRLNYLLFSRPFGVQGGAIRREPRAFTQYWRNTEPNWHDTEYRSLEHAASNVFKARGVEAGATVYIVTILNGQVHLGGALLVDAVIGLRAARKRFNQNVWEGTDHIVTRDPQPFNRDLILPMSTVKALRFLPDKPLIFKSPDVLDTQTLRGVRELTPESAELLVNVLQFARRQEMELTALFPNELESGATYTEGARKQVVVNAFERDPKAREACLDYHGYDCAVCNLNFEALYGDRGKDFIHVHHLKPMALTDGEYELNPITDLRPVCPNCHAMLHRGETVLSIEELRVILTQPSRTALP